ncbi:MAG: hypothetical protein GY713_13605 [Actinomycetia bacterium]|nr:hypothetical protein [Actinomycetes bacterium]
MVEPHDRPDAIELVDIVREFLRDDIVPVLEGQLAFHARVAVNALAIADRELRLGPGHQEAHAARLAALDCTTDVELAARIRDGELDDRYREVGAAVREMVWDKIGVMNPKYVHPHDSAQASEA